MALIGWMKMNDSVKGFIVILVSLVLFVIVGLLSFFVLFGNKEEEEAASLIFTTMSIESSVFTNSRDIGIEVYKTQNIEIDISDLIAFYLSEITTIDSEEETKKRVQEIIVNNNGTPTEYEVGSNKPFSLIFSSFLEGSFGHFTRINITEEEVENVVEEPVYEYIDGIKTQVGTEETTVTTTELVTRENPEYGVKLFFPIPYGYMYSHFDDYGNSRSFGGDRMHIGNDLPGNRNTPIVAVEDGTITKLGWNLLGGWIIEIDSGTRYYYLAHLEKYMDGLSVGSEVKGGQVIGFMGSSGYGVIGTNTALGVHLHFQVRALLDGADEPIWLNPYAFLKYIESNRAIIEWNPTDQNYMLMNGVGSF